MIEDFITYPKVMLTEALKWKQESFTQGKLRFVSHGWAGHAVWNQSHWGRTESGVLCTVADLMTEYNNRGNS